MPDEQRRILLKLSGEALMGEDAYGLNFPAMSIYARDIAGALQSGVQIAIVVGGGNIFRGVKGASSGFDRGAADGIGMLATVMNALGFRETLRVAGVDAVVMSAVAMPSICEVFSRAKALEYLETGRVVICAGGTGNPFVTTDTAATLRAAELKCDGVYKATQVDGIYSADPNSDPNAKRFDRLDYDTVIRLDLKVMDLAGIALARDASMPIIVFDVHKPDALQTVLKGEGDFTVVSDANTAQNAQKEE